MEIQINQTLQRTLQVNTKMDELYIYIFFAGKWISIAAKAKGSPSVEQTERQR